MNKEQLGDSNNHSTSKLSRRKFIKVGSATLSITILGGGLFRLFLPKQKEKYRIQASHDKPNKNPAFSFRRKSDGTAACHTQLPNGKVLKHELNNVGAEIYLVCDGRLTRHEIANIVATNLNKNPEQFADEVKKFLTELEKQNLVVTTGAVNLFYRTLVRHEKS
jgi:hypothetical protein